MSGFTKPYQANQAAFEQTVNEVAAITQTLLDTLATNASPRDRAVEADKAKARAATRYNWSEC